ncbi:MAG: hypothetical protein GC168_12790 [Candidatus Hydrogenedens sp.]|nr:hypothetical protein [Candidatus Hydrogenedens sp.]
MRNNDWDAMIDGDEFDALIESALRSEPMRPAPLDLHRKVTDRLQIADLREREVVRFRYSMTSLLLALMGAHFAAAMVIMFTNFDLLLANGLPGAFGIYDRYAVYMWQSWSSYSGAYLMPTIMLLAVGTICAALWPLRKYLRTH